jgi:uncharacterized protein YdeI (YjbR/CyaY-like superfamily)
MAKSKTNPQVDAYLKQSKNWQEEIKLLRSLLLSCSLTEEFKWNKPCYTFQDANVVILLPLKNYCALLFAKGALLQDPHHLLIKAGEHTQAARQIRLTSAQEITAKKAALKAYIQNAIAIEKAGLQVTYKRISEHKVPEELERQLDRNSALKKAFTALTPGRQRAYFIHISGAKQPATRESRVQKCIPQILAGKGMLDR